jgi:small conductance mechanosensitive channel
VIRYATPDPESPVEQVQETAVRWFDWLLGAPLQSLVAVLAGVLLLVVLRWFIGRTVRSVVSGSARVRRRAQALLQRTPARAALDSDPLAVARRVQRAETLGSVLRSASAVVVAIVVVTAVANINDWDLGPVLASAGVLGVALGFGAQTLVKDWLSGLFMLMEDQYGVGDVVNLGEATGTVEAIGLRVTQVRDLSGTLWYVRNGEVLRVGNMTQGWSRALVEVQVPPDADVDVAMDVLRQAAADLSDDPEIAQHLLGDAEVTGFEDMRAEAVTLRTLIKVAPAKQWTVQRALRARIRERFAEAGLEMALPRQVFVERSTP